MPPSLLYITPYLPSLPAGSSNYSIFALKKLAQRFEIYCISFFRPEDSPFIEKFNEFASKYSIKTELISHSPPLSKPGLLEPLSMHSLKNDALIRSLSAVCGNSLFEIAHIEHIEMAYIAPYLNSRIKSLTLHEQPSIRESSTLALRRGAELRSAIGQFVRWKLAEPYYLSQFHKIFVFTKEELGGLHMPELFKTEIVLLPAPAEVPQRKSLEKRYDMFFLGNYGHRPNLDALEFITGGMLPLFASLPSPPTVAVAGNNAPGYLEELEKKYPFFKCLGYVEDAASAISAARLFVAPILSGGGVRMKNLSALASATPVLTTERGGWGVLVGRGGVVIEKPTHKRFVNTAMKLLNDPVALDKFAKEAEITALNQNKLFQEFNYYPNLR